MAVNLHSGPLPARQAFVRMVKHQRKKLHPRCKKISGNKEVVVTFTDGICFCDGV